jgi:hypothetical protein
MRLFGSSEPGEWKKGWDEGWLGQQGNFAAVALGLRRACLETWLGSPSRRKGTTGTDRTGSDPIKVNQTKSNLRVRIVQQQRKGGQNIEVIVVVQLLRFFRAMLLVLRV